MTTIPIGGVRQGTYVILEAHVPKGGRGSGAGGFGAAEDCAPGTVSGGRRPGVEGQGTAVDSGPAGDERAIVSGDSGPGELERAIPVGVLLVDPATDRGWLRMRPRFDDLTDDTEFWDELEADLRGKLAEAGAEALLGSLEDSLSNVMRVGERQAVAVDAFTRVVDRLYGEHVGESAVRPFETHVPLYSVRAAAGSLGEEMQAEAEDWVPAPEGMRLSPDLFVAHVVGRSMEPRIPDGSLNLFRLHPVGSRQGRILLIERFGIADQSARYTVKRYTSIKRQTSEDEWEHERIRLEPLNPEFEPWDVAPQDFAVVAEWLRVIE